MPNFNQQAGNSPAATPSTPAVDTTPSTAPTPAESPTTETSPTPATSPSPARLIISSLPFHIGEVGVGYSPVTVKAKGGVPPYKWSISGGALPPGVVLSTGGSATGKPTTVGTFSFVVRVDDAAGAAAGAPSSILVFRQLKFTQTKATCGNSPSSCVLPIPYTGGVPGGKPKVQATVAAGATIDLPSPAAGCGAPVRTATKSPPPGMTTSASNGVMTLSAGPANQTTWCQWQGTITFVLVDHSPCGAGMLCASANILSVLVGVF